jgi:putative membrane protein
MSQIEELVTSHDESNYEELQNNITKINDDLSEITAVADAAETDTATLKKLLSDKIDLCIQDFETMKSVYTGSLRTSLQATNASLYSSMMKASGVLENIDVDFDSVSDTLTFYADILNSGTVSLTDSMDMAQELQTKLDEMILYMEDLQNNEDYQKLADMLENNPQKFADFVSEPTEVTEISLFEISDEQGNSYASSMSSFYSVLALYLSALFCMVIMHAKVKRKNYPEIKGKISKLQAYFGRWLTFACVSVLTSTILALGDLLFIEVQCKHPLAFVISMILIGLVFNFFAYSCAFGLGLLGESFALLCMILAVCCSSSFPMELLPWIFGRLYHYNLIVFQPGMNMLKETIGGYYEMDYWIYLLQLFAYVFAAMVIALGIGRIPVVKWFTELLEKRKNDSHVML